MKPPKKEINEKRTIAVRYATYTVARRKPEKKNVLNSRKKWAITAIKPLLTRLRINTVCYEENSNYG